MHAIEKELIEATNFKPRKKYADRQEYLKSILTAVSALEDDDFNNLSDEAAQWCNDAVEAHNNKRNADLPDFDEIEATEEDDADTPEDDADDDSEGDDAEDGDEADPDDDEGEAEDDGDGDPEEDPEDEVGADPSRFIEPEAEDEDDEPEEKPTKKSAKAKAAPKKEVTKPVKKAKPEKDAKAKADVADRNEDATLDKWGCIVGSKNSQALTMFEKGATTREVKEKLSGTYYNLLKKMVEAGHRVEKEGSFITLVHKDEGKATKKAKK